jgi:hypothetical protein
MVALDHKNGQARSCGTRLLITENLEPRSGASASLYGSEMKTNKFVFASLALLVVMEASAGYDIDKIDDYANQFDAITVSTEENSLSSLSSFTEFDASSIETSEIVNRPMALLRAPAAEPLLNNEDY